MGTRVLFVPWRREAERLFRACPYLAPVLERTGGLALSPGSTGTHFHHLARAIVYQQLSGKAAATIHGRLVERTGGRAPSAEALLSLSDLDFRACGVSGGKMRGLRDLAERTLDGRLDLRSVANLPDDALLTAIASVHGIGRWTGQMFLLFRLGRPDVFAEGDLGVRKGLSVVLGRNTLPTQKEALEFSLRWAPYRSGASWLLWRVLDT